MGREKSARREGKWAKARCTRALVHSIFGPDLESGPKRTESNAGSTGTCAP